MSGVVGDTELNVSGAPPPKGVTVKVYCSKGVREQRTA